ncbi:MAG: glycosyltransferase family 2 protein [Balneolaceae bacterium]
MQKNRTPSVAVVVVTYNGRKWVDFCFGSLAKSVIPLNIIVVDNGSEDGTVDVIEQKYLDVHIIRSPDNLGFGKGNNLGMEAALENKADYIFLLNQDAKIEPDTILKLVQKQKENPAYGILSPVHLNGNGSELDFKFSKHHMAPHKCEGLLSDLYLKNNIDKIYKATTLNAAAWLLSRDCMEKVGGFHPLFSHYGEDDNYLHRAKSKKVGIGIYPEAVIYHDRNDRSKNSYFVDTYVMRKRALLKALTNPLIKKPFQAQRKIVAWAVISSLIRLNGSQLKESIRLLRFLYNVRSQLEEIKPSSEKEYPFLNT